jgi:hypothetical protein
VAPRVPEDEGRVAAATAEQVVVRAQLRHPDVVEDDDLVRVADGREPVGRWPFERPGLVPQVKELVRELCAGPARGARAPRP